MKNPGQGWRAFVLAHYWVAALLAMVAIVAIDTVVHLRTTWELTDHHLDQPPITDATSPSGYVAGQHDLVLPYIGMDGYHWVMQTQQMLAGGGLRIRHVDYDNVPDGREVHWSSLFRWWLAVLAEVDHFYTATPLPLAVEQVVPFANTLLFVLLLIAVSPAVARRFGAGSAALLSFGAIAIYPVYESFIEGRTDHHGLAALSGMLTLLFLLGGGAGWIKSGDPDRNTALQAWLPDRAQARRWFIASGIVGGCGLWISMVSEVPVLAGVGLGALLATGLLGRGASKNDPAKPDPTLWRVWGFAGAVTSLAFYLLEYFPSHMGMRLEVNHPLYALAWAGGGELLCRLSRWWSGGQLVAKTSDWAALALSAIAVLTVPALWYLFSDQYFWVFNRFLWVFHVDYITEFFTMWTFLKSQSLGNMFTMMNPVILLAIPMAVWSWRVGVPRPVRALLMLGLLPGVLTFIFSAWQIRWVEINYSLWLAALVGVVKVVSLDEKLLVSRPFKILAAIFLTWMLLPNPVSILSRWVQNNWTEPVNGVDSVEVISRDIAQQLRARVGNEPTVVISGSTSTTWLIYWGGFQGLGTCYWENLSGLQMNADIYGASNPRQAFDLLQKLHAKYLVILPWVDSPAEYARLSRNLRKSDPVPDDAFAWQLTSHGVLPQWLRPVDCPLPQIGPAKNNALIIYKIVPNQSVSEAFVRLAQWHQSQGNLPFAVQLINEALKREPENVPALVAGAWAVLASGQQNQFNAIAQHLRSMAAIDKPMELDDRLHLAAIFDAVNDHDNFQKQISLALHEADANSLRQLRQESLYALLSLSTKAGLLEQRPGLWPYVNSLFNLNWRLRFLQEYSAMEKDAGRPGHAAALLREALSADPASPAILGRLAWLLATSPDDSLRNGKEALALARQAHEIDQGQHVNITDALACALAENGEFSQAIALEDQAVKNAEAVKATDLANSLRSHLALFQNRLPYRDISQPAKAGP